MAATDHVRGRRRPTRAVVIGVVVASLVLPALLLAPAGAHHDPDHQDGAIGSRQLEQRLAELEAEVDTLHGRVESAAADAALAYDRVEALEARVAVLEAAPLEVTVFVDEGDDNRVKAHVSGVRLEGSVVLSYVWGIGIGGPSDPTFFDLVETVAVLPVGQDGSVNEVVDVDDECGRSSNQFDGPIVFRVRGTTVFGESIDASGSDETCTFNFTG